MLKKTQVATAAAKAAARAEFRAARVWPGLMVVAVVVVVPQPGLVALTQQVMLLFGSIHNEKGTRSRHPDL